MISVTVLRGAAGRVEGFRSRGHANFADYGEDIVCAAVAAITQTAVLGLKEHVGAAVEVEQAPGWLQCVFEDGAHEEQAAAAVLETMVLGLEEIARQYPKQVRVREVVAEFGEGRRGQWPS